MSILLQQTNNILTAAAKATQKFIYLNNYHKNRKPPLPPEISEASSNHSHCNDILKKVLSNPTISEVDTLSLKANFSKKKADLRKTKHRLSVLHEADRVQKLDTIYSSNPGFLPLPALLNICQLTSFAMICKKPKNILQWIAEYILTFFLTPPNPGLSRSRASAISKVYHILRFSWQILHHPLQYVVITAMR